MTVENEKLSSLYYVYGGDGFTGNETIQFAYQEMSLPLTLKTNFDMALTSGNKTWKNYVNDGIYSELVAAFQEDVANKVPFLEPKFEGGQVFDGYWNGEEGAASEVFISATVTDDKGYIQSYKEYIKTLGYVSTDNKVFEKSEDNIRLTVGDTLDDFLHVSLITPVTK